MILQWRGFKSPTGVQRQSPGKGHGEVPEAEAKCEITVQLLTFSCKKNLGFNEYRSRAWTVYFANTILKNSEDSIGGVWVRRWAYLKLATARVDSRLKLTFGKLVSKSTHHV